MEVRRGEAPEGLENENARLKKLVVERDLEIEVMKEIAARNVWSARSVQGSGSI
jgi:putative transposase